MWGSVAGCSPLNAFCHQRPHHFCICKNGPHRTCQPCRHLRRARGGSPPHAPRRGGPCAEAGGSGSCEEPRESIRQQQKWHLRALAAERARRQWHQTATADCCCCGKKQSQRQGLEANRTQNLLYSVVEVEQTSARGTTAGVSGRRPALRTLSQGSSAQWPTQPSQTFGMQEFSKIELVKPAVTVAVANLIMAAPSFAEPG